MCPSSSSTSLSSSALAVPLNVGGGMGDGDGDGAAQQRLLAQAFAVLDRDGDGTIRATDLSAFFDTCVGQAISAEEAAFMVTAADLDGDGAVDMREFLRILTPPSLSSGSSGSRSNSSNVLRGMFDVLDADGDGVVDEHDLRHAMDAMLGHPITDDDLHDMLHHVAAAARPSAAPSSSSSTCYIDFDRFSTLFTAPAGHH